MSKRSLVIAVIILMVLFYVFVFINKVKGDEVTGTASWYSLKSVLKEGKSGVMANGKLFNEERDTAATWDYSFGTKLSVTAIRSGRTCIVVVTDRGPAKRLYRMGRIIDLSKGAFSKLADLKQGLIQVKIEVIE